MANNETFNNTYVKDENNKFFQRLLDVNIHLWMTAEGDYRYRFGTDGEVITVTEGKLKKILKNLLKHPITIDDPAAIDQSYNLDTTLLHLVSCDRFDPFVDKEFYTIDNEVFRNTFRTTKYLELRDRYIEEPFEKEIDISAIDKLILHLVNYKNDRKHWVYNWLAYFFQGLKKSPVALVSTGKQGAGKGILFSHIIKPLFGNKQTIQVNDKTTKGNFLGGVVEGKLFINLDEISTSAKNNQELKNFLKMLVSNTSGTFEKKFETVERETMLFAQVYITSNEPKALDVERNDRRYTVFRTAGNLSEYDFLGFGSFEALISKIKSELEDFAYFLASFDVNVQLATTAQKTREKDALINVSSTKFELFANAIKEKDLDFFEDIDDYIFNQVKESFRKNRIAKNFLQDLFYATYGESISTRKLMDQLRAIDPEFFDDDNTVGRSGGNLLFVLDGSKLLTPKQDTKDDNIGTIVPPPPPPPLPETLNLI